MSVDHKILGLLFPSDPSLWKNDINLEEILTDHAYCEMKAAVSCISLIQMNPDKSYLVDCVMPVITEEWGHFRLVVQELKKRNLSLGKQRKDRYVNELINFKQKGGHAADRFLDQLLFMALIEARSCDRFKLLSERMKDPYLKKFYRRFMESEAGHYTLFIELGNHYCGKEKTKKRWLEWLKYEAEIVQKLSPDHNVIH
ncbi:MAG: tRNA-(ms[2]io[6]A)-hydroxylase [Bacteroidetes bacterium]|nr:tRNA-(ms[2]io[6]A)-hydroxylase [Bacteroidota bacterium]